MWLYIIYKVLVQLLNLRQYGATFFFVMDCTTYALIGISYLYILLQSFWSNEKEYIQDNFEEEHVHEYFTNIFRQKPSISVSITCYHFETRSRTVNYTDPQGNPQSRLETYTETVITYRGSNKFSFNSWRDVSDRQKLPSIGSKILRIKVIKDINFADEESSAAFNRFKEDYLNGNRYRDAYMDHSVEHDIPGFKERLMGCNRKPPCWMNLPCFFLAHLLFLGWPYRWLLKGKTDKTEFVVKKEVSINQDIMDSTAPRFATTTSSTPNPCEDHLAYPMANLATINHGFI